MTKNRKVLPTYLDDDFTVKISPFYVNFEEFPIFRKFLHVKSLLIQFCFPVNSRGLHCALRQELVTSCYFKKRMVEFSASWLLIKQSFAVCYHHFLICNCLSQKIWPSCVSLSCRRPLVDSLTGYHEYLNVEQRWRSELPSLQHYWLVRWKDLVLIISVGALFANGENFLL